MRSTGTGVARQPRVHRAIIHGTNSGKDARWWTAPASTARRHGGHVGGGETPRWTTGPRAATLNQTHVAPDLGGPARGSEVHATVNDVVSTPTQARGAEAVGLNPEPDRGGHARTAAGAA